MSNNFGCIGFDIRSEEECLDLAYAVGQDGAIYDAGNGNSYARWYTDEYFGPELWVRILSGNEFGGIMPYFRGKSVRRIQLEGPIEVDGDCELDARYYAWANPGSEGKDTGDYPFAFDATSLYPPNEFPAVCNIALTGFAQEPVQVFASLEEFNAQEKDEDDSAPILSPEVFIPTGLFTENGGTTEAFAAFSGRILETAELVNPSDNHPYVWALVETYGGPIDVVCDVSYVPRKLKEGYYIMGSYWLCADFVSP